MTLEQREQGSSVDDAVCFQHRIHRYLDALVVRMASSFPVEILRDAHWNSSPRAASKPNQY